MRKGWRLGVAIAVAALAMGFTPSLAASPSAAKQISADPFGGDGGQHSTQVEPDTFSYGTTVVSAFQSGRFHTGGGASGISFATSVDGGKTWVTGVVPGLTVLSGGTANRATDPSVSYDPVRNVWMIASMLITDPGTQTRYVVSRSTDGGLTWGSPVIASPGNGTFAHDKGWLVCDTWTGSSPYAGNCYLGFSDFINGRLSIVRSTDGGLTWGGPVGSSDNTAGLGIQPVVQPNGTVVAMFLVGGLPNQMRAFRSTNGGVSYGATVTAAGGVLSHRPTSMRALPVPSAEVDGAGTIYLAWADCRFRAGCSGANPPAFNDIVYTTTTDGVSWTPVVRVPIDRVDSTVDHFIPGIGVDRSTSGSDANIAITYYYFEDGSCVFATCELHAGFISSRTGGDRWSHQRTLNRTPMSLSWLPDTAGLGRMVGDYISTSFVPGSSYAVPVFALASEPVGPTFSQEMYSARLRVES